MRQILFCIYGFWYFFIKQQHLIHKCVNISQINNGSDRKNNTKQLSGHQPRGRESWSWTGVTCCHFVIKVQCPSLKKRKQENLQLSPGAIQRGGFMFSSLGAYFATRKSPPDVRKKGSLQAFYENYTLKISYTFQKILNIIHVCENVSEQKHFLISKTTAVVDLKDSGWVNWIDHKPSSQISQ